MIYLKRATNVNSRHLKQASIPFLAVMAIWWWFGGDEPTGEAPLIREPTAARSTTAMPRYDGMQGYYGIDRGTAWTDSQDRADSFQLMPPPTQRYWAAEQAHIDGYRFRPLSEREKRRLYNANVRSEPGAQGVQPRSYTQAIPTPYDQPPGYDVPRWREGYTGGYSYRPIDPNRVQERSWGSGSDSTARWSSPYAQGPKPRSSLDDRWTAEPPSWQSPAERMLPAAKIGLDPTLTSLF